MFCPNCGAQIPDDSAVCGSCGQALRNPQQTSAPVGYMPPQQPPRFNPAPAAPVSKKEYMATMATQGTKNKRKLVLVTMLICMALIVGGVLATLNMPFYEIPFVSLVLGASDADVDELEDEMSDLIDELENDLELQEDTMSDDEVEAAEKLIDGMKEFEDNMSITGVQNMVDLVEDVLDEYEDLFMENDIDEMTQTMEELDVIMSAVVGAVIGFFFLPMLFTILGGSLRSTGLTITAIIFTAIAQLIFCGFLWVALSMAVGIFQAVLCSQINREYKDYRMGRIAV